MSTLTDNVSLTITIDSVGVARAGFGILLILSYNAAWAERTRTYESTADVAADFAAGTPEYLAASAAFSQSPHPEQIMIGRAANKPTQSYTIGVGTLGPAGSLYAINVVGQGVTATTVSFKSLADLTFGTVNTATDQVTITAHGMTTGDGPYYVSNSGGGLPSPLTANTQYWIIVSDANTIKLATSKANAIALTAIDLTTAGTGTQTLLRGATSQDVVIQQLVQGLSAVTGANYTAATSGSAGSLVAVSTASVAGNWFSLEVTSYSLLSNKQTHADPGIAADLDAIKLESDAWYGLHTTANSKAQVLAAAAWIEASGNKLYIVSVVDTDAINVVVGSGTDTLAALNALTYNRTAGAYYPSPAAMFAAAWMGRMFPDQPGSATWIDKTLAGITATNLNSTHRTNLKARNASYYVSVAGLNKTQGGTVAGGTFKWIDVTQGLDWLEDDMTKSVYEALAGMEKVPFTDAGVAVIRSEMKSSLKRAAGYGIVDGNTIDIQVPLVSTVSASNKALRVLPDMKFSATLQGAIHSVQITGVVTF